MQERDIIIEVLDALPKDGGPIRVKELKNRVKMSSASLYKVLPRLEMMGIIQKNIVHSTRAIGVEYSLSKDFELFSKNLDHMLGTIDKLILELFKKYAEAEKDQKDIIFDTYLSSIIGLLKAYKALHK